MDEKEKELPFHTVTVITGLCMYPVDIDEDIAQIDLLFRDREAFIQIVDGEGDDVRHPVDPPVVPVQTMDADGADQSQGDHIVLLLLQQLQGLAEILFTERKILVQFMMSGFVADLYIHETIIAFSRLFP